MKLSPFTYKIKWERRYKMNKDQLFKEIQSHMQRFEDVWYGKQYTHVR